MPALSFAHTSEQGFVLLLPTKVYMTAGVLAVIVTVIFLVLMPSATSHKLLTNRPLLSVRSWPQLATVTSLFSLACLVAFIALGFLGSRDPLKNPLPLIIWTFWWVGLVGIQGFVGNLWHWINPWRGLCRLFGREQETALGLRLQALGAWPALVLFLLFILFALAYPSPDDPDKLAVVVSIYWLLTFVAMMIFGYKAWIQCGEFTHIVMAFFALMSPFGVSNKQLHLGMPSSRAYGYSTTLTHVSLGVFALVLLGSGSFDGINETFWWLSHIGVNPLAYPGRSAVIGQTVIGLLLANALIILMFLLCVYAGLQLLKRPMHLGNASSDTVVTLRRAFVELSISILPIAYAYHLAHYLVVFLVNMQYLLAVSTDPLANGADYLGLGRFYVTTGFLNTHHSVEIIWLAQAGIVVLGHILSLILAHGIAVRLFGTARRAALSQTPLALFMILYTWLGLWLLASPKGG